MPYISTNAISRTGTTGLAAQRQLTTALDATDLDGNADLSLLVFQEAWAFRCWEGFYVCV